MRDTRPLACVMGDMDLLRPLGLARIPCVVVARPGAAPRFSRFARASSRVPPEGRRSAIQAGAAVGTSATIGAIPGNRS